MSYTKTTLINRLGVELNIVGLGDALAAEDIENLDSRVESLAADLNGRKILYLADINEIPDELFEPIVDVFVMRLGPSYARPRASVADIEFAESRVKAASAPTAPNRTLTTDPIYRQGRGTRFNGRVA